MHMKGLGKTYEKKIWKYGIFSWENALDVLPELPLSPKKTEFLEKGIYESVKMLENKNHLYFANSLPGNEHWRAYPEF